MCPRGRPPRIKGAGPPLLRGRNQSQRRPRARPASQEAASAIRSALTINNFQLFARWVRRLPAPLQAALLRLPQTAWLEASAPPDRLAGAGRGDRGQGTDPGPVGPRVHLQRGGGRWWGRTGPRARAGWAAGAGAGGSPRERSGPWRPASRLGGAGRPGGRAGGAGRRAEAGPGAAAARPGRRAGSGPGPRLRPSLVRGPSGRRRAHSHGGPAEPAGCARARGHEEEGRRRPGQPGLGAAPQPQPRPLGARGDRGRRRRRGARTGARSAGARRGGDPRGPGEWHPSGPFPPRPTRSRAPGDHRPVPRPLSGRAVGAATRPSGRRGRSWEPGRESCERPASWSRWLENCHRLGGAGAPERRAAASSLRGGGPPRLPGCGWGGNGPPSCPSRAGGGPGTPGGNPSLAGQICRCRRWLPRVFPCCWSWGEGCALAPGSPIHRARGASLWGLLLAPEGPF